MLALVFVTHTPMRNKIIMAVSLKIFLKHQQQDEKNFRSRFDAIIILCLSPWLQNTAHVSSACIGFCDSYSDEKQNNYGR